MVRRSSCENSAAGSGALSPDGGVSPRTPDIDQLIIDPKAEGSASQSRTGSGKDEVQFFTGAGEQYKLLHNQQSLGLLGKLWGSSNSAPTNIAGLLLLLCFVFGAMSFPAQAPHSYK